MHRESDRDNAGDKNRRQDDEREAVIAADDTGMVSNEIAIVEAEEPLARDD